jgi:Fe2+ or Zn2+ uptake regulation protein
VSARAIDDTVHATVDARLRRAGQRYTDQRRRLVEILALARSPLSMPDIVRGRRGLAQSSVYRNLSGLVEAGVVRRIVTEEEFGRYELAEDLTGHHHHVICSNCGRTRDVTLPAAVERTLDRTLDGVARRAGFAGVSHRLDLFGTCHECAATQAPPRT